jgi:hypothetical protein
MDVYIAQPVRDISSFYGSLLEHFQAYPTIEAHLGKLASRMWEGVRQENEVVLKEISNYHREHLGREIKMILAGGLTEEDCRKATANEYGFRRWTEVAHQTQPYELKFEMAVNALLSGKSKELKDLITQNPWLLNFKSRYGHRATLLHYSVSNGVEMWRQRVPLNLPEMVRFLLESGINTQARMQVYGGEYTASELLLSSTHPRDAGIFDELKALLAT